MNKIFINIFIKFQSEIKQLRMGCLCDFYIIMLYKTMLHNFCIIISILLSTNM